ncbi:DUF3035 domain-containing protein [Brevundimonas sp. 2R-24]|uniref:DUF3035 domain-containing protein n=1 Tax=Peiella sedimenti TaxID=3061083 RepID=A0ABT8SHD8_9CAUL|nr:DUF3035 domain-containing protein [Caulobacteraceae bacterium XZ-24]
MKLRAFSTVAVIGAASLAASGCNTLRDQMGVSKITPDEFLVVSTAPLTLPPEYGLTPPRPGQPRPQELAPESEARQVLLGQRAAAERSAAESALASQAGADRADPLARFVIDDEVGDLAHKQESFADRLMFWRRGDPSTQSATSTAAPGGGTLVIDPASEAERLRALTGGRDVVIRRSEGGIKLPGM